ncbi:hypothetical protein BRADI_2g09202v3 [Brachypodium distachyon]|uniref:Uncharacterized protein n=1 Tax=Brachypodium distachyon TaxID=15368 RepID=A0A2K2D7P1_BRADI|nr:hypothetical protein BRADI_2g09202v3 [Brachypodium distachyon]
MAVIHQPGTDSPRTIHLPPPFLPPHLWFPIDLSPFQCYVRAVQECEEMPLECENHRVNQPQAPMSLQCLHSSISKSPLTLNSYCTP